MNNPVRVLILEDSEDDTLLILRELQHGGYSPEYKRVDTAEAMTSALKEKWDVILADYHMLHFNAPVALNLLRKSGLDIPFIVVSGNIGEDTAVALMKAGAYDYVMKDNLKRLTPAIKRELQEAAERLKKKQTEEFLQESEENFRNSLDNSPLGIRILTKDGDTIYANKTFLDIYGYSTIEELESTPTKKRYTPECYSAHRKRAEMRKHGESVPPEYELSIIRKDGEIRHLLVFRREVFWNGSLQFQSLYQDITERKQAEESLMAERENFRNSMDNSPVGIIMATADGQILYANRAVLEMYGYHKTEELNTVSQQKRYTPESFADCQDRKALRLAGKHVPANFEVSIIRENGVIRHLAATHKEIMWNGQMQFQVIYQDITEQKTMIREIERRAVLLDVATDSIFLHDLDGNILYANKAAYLSRGYSQDEILKMKIHDFAPQEYIDHLNRRLKTLQTDKDAIFEAVDICKDKSLIPVEISAHVIEQDGQKLILSSARDITERKRAEQSLRDSEAFNSSLLENAPTPIMVLNADTSLRYVNPAAEKITGFVREELIGTKPPFLFWPEDRKSTRLNSSHIPLSRMPSSA